MSGYQAADRRTEFVYSKDWGFGEIVGHNGKGVRIQFGDKWREIDFDYYHSQGRICYVFPVHSSVNYLLDRKVKYLVHFTPIENLKAIMKEGIVPRDRQKTPGIWTDELRLDGHPDCSCFSVSYPNYSMLYQKRKNRRVDEPDGMDKFALLLIDPAALREIDDNDIAYYQTNAAGYGKNDFREHTGLAALSSMFADSVYDDGGAVIRDRQMISSEFTTHPQAEILIRGVIPAKYIRKIVLTGRNAVRYLPCIPKRTEVDFDLQMFWPADGSIWAEYEMKRRNRSNGRQTGFCHIGYPSVC